MRSEVDKQVGGTALVDYHNNNVVVRVFASYEPSLSLPSYPGSLANGKKMLTCREMSTLNG